MKGNITIKYLQEYIKAKDNDAECNIYFIKLVEELGELSKALLSDAPRATEENIKGTIEEEIWDVMYYLLVMANKLDIDIEKWIPVKENINNEKHHNNTVFDPS